MPTTDDLRATVRYYESGVAYWRARRDELGAMPWSPFALDEYVTACATTTRLGNRLAEERGKLIRRTGRR
jgi:hypothetical protein